MAGKKRPKPKSKPSPKPQKKAPPRKPSAKLPPKSIQRNKAGQTKGLRVGSLNLTKSNTAREQIEDIKRAMARADIVSVNEVFKNDRVLKWARNNGFGVFMAKGRAADSAIIWNKSEVRLVKGSGGSAALNQLEGKRGGARTRYAAYAQFENVASGEKFWQISAHTVNMGQGRQGLNNRIQDQQYGTLAGLAKRLSKTAPVVLGGDLNSKHPSIAGLASSTDGFGVMHVMAGDGLDAKRTWALGGFHSDKRFVVTRFGLNGKGKPTKPGKPPVATPPNDGGEFPELDPPGIEDLPLPGPKTFQGYWEGDLGGGPMQTAPGAAPKQNGSPLVAALGNIGAPLSLQVALSGTTSRSDFPTDLSPRSLLGIAPMSEAKPGLTVRPDIDLNTASEMVSKVSGGFFETNPW